MRLGRGTLAVTGGSQLGRMPRQAKMPVPRRARELTSRRTANARVYELADGRLQAVISAGPVNYQDSRGRWQPIDTTMRPATRAGYVDANVSNTFGSFLGSSAGRLVRFDAPGGGWLSIGLDGGHVGRPAVAGNTVTYAGVAPGTALSYQVTPEALKGVHHAGVALGVAVAVVHDHGGRRPGAVAARRRVDRVLR